MRLVVPRVKKRLPAGGVYRTRRNSTPARQCLELSTPHEKRLPAGARETRQPLRREIISISRRQGGKTLCLTRSRARIYASLRRWQMP